jgi:hypothetical protein
MWLGGNGLVVWAEQRHKGSREPGGRSRRETE